MYAQCVNSAYTVHNSKICLPKSTNAGKKKKKKKRKAENVKMKTWTRYANGHLIRKLNLWLLKTNSNLAQFCVTTVSCD